MTVDTAPNEPVRAIVVIGTSTGGPRALTELFRSLPVLPSVTCCIVQHMPAGFTANLAKRLNELSAWSISEGQSGTELRSGHAYIAPGGMQMRVENDCGRMKLHISKDLPVCGHQPSVDVLFNSVVACSQSFCCTVGVILTGMGRDGAAGLRNLRDHGAYTVAESEETAVIYGMPKAAVACSAAVDVVPLPKIANLLELYLRDRFTHGLGR